MDSEDVLRPVKAVQLFGPLGAALELRAFSDGVLVLQSLRHSDAQVHPTPETSHTLHTGTAGQCVHFGNLVSRKKSHVEPPSCAEWSPHAWPSAKYFDDAKDAFRSR